MMCMLWGRCQDRGGGLDACQSIMDHFGVLLSHAHGCGDAGCVEQRRGGRGGSSSIRGLKATQRSCKTTLTGGGRSHQHDEHIGVAFLICMVGTFLGSCSYSKFVHMTDKYVPLTQAQVYGIGDIDNQQLQGMQNLIRYLTNDHCNARQNRLASTAASVACSAQLDESPCNI